MMCSTLPYVWAATDGTARLVSDSTGYVSSIVNGEVLLDHGVHTGALPGRILRS